MQGASTSGRRSINNVETLSNVTGIVANGAAAFRKVGTAKSPGTQLISISGHVNRPGVYEVEYGYPWRSSSTRTAAACSAGGS